MSKTGEFDANQLIGCSIRNAKVNWGARIKTILLLAASLLLGTLFATGVLGN